MKHMFRTEEAQQKEKYSNSFKITVHGKCHEKYK